MKKQGSDADDPEAFLSTDLRRIMRTGSNTHVKINLGYPADQFIPWLILGRVSVSKIRSNWWLEGALRDGATDFEHDASYAVRLPLIGLQIDGVWGGTTQIGAWVDPNCGEDFRVATAGYNPMLHATVCRRCKKARGQGHRIVPEGMALPPFDPVLYRLVHGRQVEIYIGVEGKI